MKKTTEPRRARIVEDEPEAPPASALSRPLTSSSLVDQVAERLEMAIMNGELQAGARLSEQALAASLGVSRSPLREALRRLEGRRLVERVPNIGARVTMLATRDLEEILQIREFLEALACRLAATNMTDQEVAELESLLKRREERKVVAGPQLYDKSAGYDFHMRIIMGCGNRKLIDMLCGDLYYLMRVHRYRSASTPDRAKQAPVEHHAIVAALKARDGDTAEREMRKHLQLSHARILQELDTPAEEPVPVDDGKKRRRK